MTSAVAAAAYTLVDTLGVRHPLDGSEGIAVLGARGLGMVPIEVTTSKLPYAPGTVPRRVVTTQRTIDLRLHLEAADPGALDETARTLRRWVLPGSDRTDTPAQATLEIVCDDGTPRQIAVLYGGGLGGDTGNASGRRDLLDVLTLVAPDPYFDDVADAVVTLTRGETGTQWFPWPPVSLISDTIFGEPSITNHGDIEVWPVWTISGPCDSVRLANQTSGEELTIALALVDGQVLTIDTRPRHKTVVDADGVSYYGAKSGPFWPLAVGANLTLIAMPGIGDASAVSLSYRQQFASARI